MNFKTIALAADHAGYPVKEAIKAFLIEKGIEVKDFGTHSEESTDYADYAHPMASAVESKEYELGIAICGSGNGINMTVNKHQGIRAALCWSVEISEMARLHNDANICTVPGRLKRPLLLLINLLIQRLKAEDIRNASIKYLFKTL